MLEVFDASGSPTGRAKPRAAIHLDGDWHQAFHCWVLRRHGREVVLQRRSLAKDTFGGLWDATAAGHWRFGETAVEAAREIAEELGIDVPFDRLTYRHRERVEHSFPNGLIDREFHQVYVLEDDRSLTAYQPDPSEVIGLAAFPVAELLAVQAGEAASVTASEAVVVESDGRVAPTRISVGRAELVPYAAARLSRNLGQPNRVDTL